MKIYFNASLRGKKQYAENYDLIVKAIKHTGNDVSCAPVMAEDVEEGIEGNVKKVADFFKARKQAMKTSDVVVFDVSFPSTGIGYEIALALQFSKPVIALHVKDAPPNYVIENIKDEKFQLVDYLLADVDRAVEDALTYATEQMDTRFNFFISPDIAAYLDSVSKQKKVPRAVYLRELIEEDMAESEFGE